MYRMILPHLTASWVSRIGKSRRFCSTWSPLCRVFNSRPKSCLTEDNQAKNTGLFLVPELSDLKGFVCLNEACSSRADELIAEAVSEDRPRPLVQVFDELSDTLCQVADLSEFIRIAHTKEDYARVAADTCGQVTAIVEQLNTNKELYLALKHVVARGDPRFPDSDLDRRVNSLFLFDFEQNGIHLQEGDRQRIAMLNGIILQLGQEFVNGCAQEKCIDRQSVPESYLKYFDVTRKHIVVTGLDADATSPIWRELGYRFYLRHDPAQEQLLTQLLGARAELAHLCGFGSYAERCLRGGLLDRPQAVRAFLDHLTDALKPRAEREFMVLREMRNQELNREEALPIWDVPFYTAKYKARKLQMNMNDCSPYFSLGSCMEGLRSLFENIYGITLEHVEMEPGECWAGDVYKLNVVHETEGVLGVIYCDFFARARKANQDSHFTIRGGRQLPNGDYQPPIVVVMLNLQMPRWGAPCLLTPSILENLFHEMGHAMHSMLGRTRYQHVAGTRCTTDIAEVPSVLMEYFARDERVLATFARHFQTGDPMPAAMLRTMCESRAVLVASDTQLQTFYAALDQRYHGSGAAGAAGGETTTEVLREVQARYYHLGHVAGTAWQHRFGHLYGYGGKYYAYLTSRALASWIWARLFAARPLCRASGERLRRDFLAHGGAKPPARHVGDFLGREATPDHLADALLAEIDARSAVRPV